MLNGAQRPVSAHALRVREPAGERSSERASTDGQMGTRNRSARTCVPSARLLAIPTCWGSAPRQPRDICEFFCVVKQVDLANPIGLPTVVYESPPASPGNNEPNHLRTY